MLPGIPLVAFGVLFIYGSVFSRQVRGALSQGPWYPMKFWHRAIFLSTGAFMLIYGLALLSAVLNNKKYRYPTRHQIARDVNRLRYFERR